MKKFFTRVFVTLGIVFFIIILAGVYLWITDPYNVKPILFSTEDSLVADDASVGVDKHPLLSPTQEQALEDFGIDPVTVPTELTVEQKECFVEKFGEARVLEIMTGATPSLTEFFEAKGCL